MVCGLCMVRDGSQVGHDWAHSDGDFSSGRGCGLWAGVAAGWNQSVLEILQAVLSAQVCCEEA